MRLNFVEQIIHIDLCTFISDKKYRDIFIQLYLDQIIEWGNNCNFNINTILSNDDVFSNCVSDLSDDYGVVDIIENIILKDYEDEPDITVCYDNVDDSFIVCRCDLDDKKSAIKLVLKYLKEYEITNEDLFEVLL